MFRWLFTQENKDGQAQWWRLNDLIANIPQGVVVLNAKNEIILANPAVKKILKLETGDVTLSNFVNRFSVDVSSAVKEVLTHAKSVHLSEVRVDKKILELFINPTHDEGKNVNGAVIIVNDMTYRRLFEEALRHEIDKTQRYLDVAGVLMIVVDTDCRVSLINKKGCAILDRYIEEVLGRDWFETFTPESVRRKLKDDFTRVISEKGPPQEYVEYPILARDGSERLIAWHNTILKDDTGNVIGMLSSGEDITEGRKAEVKLKEEHDRANAIITSMGEGLLVIDKSYVITLANRTAERLLGKKGSDILGKKMQDVFTIVRGEKKLSFKDWPIVRTLASGKDVVVELKDNIFYKLASGKTIPVTIATTPLRGDEVKGVVMVFRDATREKEIDRMKTEFISLASHQLRTPLSAMKWFAEMLLDGDVGKLTNEQKEFVKNMNSSNERMIELVNSLLNISRIESGRLIIEPQLTDLGKLLKELLTELMPKVTSKKLHLVVSVHHDLPDIYLDPKLIRHVYLNLLTNAIRYTPSDGEIFVFVSKKADEVISQITDTGFGIPRKDFPQVFQKFYRGTNILKHVPDGTGLGLYLTRAIVESSGGKIWFTSGEGKGTTFWFSLPMRHAVARKGEVSLDS